MKIFSVADIHGNLSIYREIKKYVEENQIDVLILPGDLYPKPPAVTFGSFKAIQSDYAKQINDILKGLTIPIYYLLGNDDWIEEGLNCGINIHNQLVEYNGIYFTGFQYVRKTGFNTNRECSENKIKEVFLEQSSRLDLNNMKPLVFIAHTPLYLVQDKLLNQKRVGSRKLRMEMEKLNPAIYLCGHIHEDFGADKLNDTHVFNCACMYDMDLLRGYVIDFDEQGYISYHDVVKLC